MEISQILFYLLAAITLAGTVLAVTNRRSLHAALYFIVSLLGLAGLFYLLGAPLLAALQVILYAGAIMMLLLFVIMILPRESGAAVTRPSFWAGPLLLSLLTGISMAMLLRHWPGAQTVLTTAMLSPRHFGQILFSRYWLAVELVSLLLFVALVGALHFGGREMLSAACRQNHGENR